MMAALLEVKNLTLAINLLGRRVVNDVSFTVNPGEIVGLVGESGSGKTLAARSIMGFVPPSIEITSGSIMLQGSDVTTASAKQLQALRGPTVGMVFQEPMTSLNPGMKIGAQMDEALALHSDMNRSQRQSQILAMLERVGIRDPQSALKCYPHHFSGGMRQRIMLASVMLLKPALLIADEPTTALDAVVQRDVLELMVALTKENDTAVLLISHDLGMIARYTDRVVVMRRGDLVEAGSTEQLIAAPKHPYTQELLAALPRRLPARFLPQTKTPIISVQGLVVDYPGHGSLLRRAAPKRALHGIDIEIAQGEVVAIVGGSGSGKTTLGHTIAGLITPTSGTISYCGLPVGASKDSFADYRLNCQVVFQDPYSSLDPRMNVRALVREPLRLLTAISREDKDARVDEVLQEVGLGDGFGERFPHELSGGQRQRVAIARAVVRRPRFVVADEPVSALDVTVRAQVLELFAKLQRVHGFSCLFISHDLGVVEQIADRVIVMNDGQIVEQGTRDEVFDTPQAPYTKKLLSAVPSLESNGRGGVQLLWRSVAASA